jgi:hypothetical protein
MEGDNERCRVGRQRKGESVYWGTRSLLGS